MNKKQLKSFIKIIEDNDSNIVIEISDFNIRGKTSYRGEGEWEFRFETGGTFNCYTSIISGNSKKQVLNKAISTIKNRLSGLSKIIIIPKRIANYL